MSLREDVTQAIAFTSSPTLVKPLLALRLSLTGEQRWSEEAGRIDLMRLITQTVAGKDLDKVMLVRATDLQFSQSVNVAATMASSRRSDLNCYHFFTAFSVDTAFLGSSLEHLYQQCDMTLCIEALAGIVTNHLEDHRAWQLGDWLMKDDKNRRENMLMIKDTCQRLQGCTQTPDVLSPQVLRLCKVQHLRRCIQTELNQADDVLYLVQLQPTAAIADIPRELAREFIQQNEPFEREWYVGLAGYLSLHQSEFCMSLRSAKISVDVVRPYIEAGIVRGLDPRQE